MRQFFRFQYKFRQNIILLNYGKNFHQFSYIETLFDRLDPSIELIESPPVNTFLHQVQKHHQNLHQLQRHDFSQQDLRICLNNNNQVKQQASNVKFKHQNQCLTKLSSLSQLTHSYQQMQHHLYQNLSKQNLTKSIITLTNFNCIDIRIWQKIISFVQTHYKSSTLDQRLIYITAISEYMKKFQGSFNTSKNYPFKFMFPESYLVDLISFRSFFLSIIQDDNDFITQTDTLQQQHKKLLILLNLIYLIMKATKKTDMNIYSVKQYFLKRKKQMITICSRYKKSQTHKSLLYNIYFIYSYLNVSDGAFFQQIERYYYEWFSQLMMEDNANQPNNNNAKNLSQQIAHKSKQVNKLLSIWKLNNRTNLQIYTQHIKPFLNFIITYNLQQSYYTNLCLNLLTAGIKDYEIIEQMVDKNDELIQETRAEEDQFVHMLKHYLNVVKGEDNYYESGYEKCCEIQDQTILKYLNDRKMTLFSSCLKYNNTTNNANIFSNKRKYQRHFEHHRVQKIWHDIVIILFQNKCQVIENAPFCNYQIDFLILTKVGLIAIEIQGGHYNKKQFNKSLPTSTQNSDQTIPTTGKKQMRQIVLKSYGIKFVKVHCQEKMPIYIMQSRNVQLGVEFLKKKIAEQAALVVEDL